MFVVYEKKKQFIQFHIGCYVKQCSMVTVILDFQSIKEKNFVKML
jgi:aerobic-type carbon monoxide dehydrogenase small subunit (CoxS/CutS family)